MTGWVAARVCALVAVLAAMNLFAAAGHRDWPLTGAWAVSTVLFAVGAVCTWLEDDRQ